ncbi:MAG: endonuclease/exonuclease/phosphatase family protein [Oscillospiraceae bacterium]|nr:endonuclease/exonuclease/phosphatase family protein [Oscillospiraceae bacterium]
MKVMSFNLLCWGNGENFILNRMGLAVRTIRNEEPELFGVQEAHNTWMRVLCAAFPDYSYVGVGRDNGKRKGEFSAVFYKKALFTKIDSGSFWLSETPDKPGIKGWDAACVRVCSWAKLREKSTGKEFMFMNTHLDHVGPVAMQKGAELIASKAAEIGQKLPAVLTGDFNITPDSVPCKAVKDGGFTDTRDIAAKTDMSNTFHGYSSGEEGISIIDYVFVKGDIEVKSVKVIKKKINGHFPSDHFPVVADINIK